MEETSSKVIPHIAEGFTNIKTPHGIGKFHGVKISELGHIMIRIYFPEGKHYINYTIGNFQKLLKGSNLQLSE